MKKCTCQNRDGAERAAPPGVGAALAAATARLGVVLGLGAWLVVLVANEIATALVYTIAAMLGLFAWSCPG